MGLETCKMYQASFTVDLFSRKYFINYIITEAVSTHIEAFSLSSASVCDKSFFHECALALSISLKESRMM